MNHMEIEAYFGDLEKTNLLLEQFKDIFSDIMTLETRLAERDINTVEEIKEGLYFVTSLENKCMAVYIVADTYKTGEESRLKNKKIQDKVKAKVKVNVSQCKEEASSEVQYLRRVRNIFQMYKDRAMNIKSTLKASYYNNKEYKSENE